MAEVITKLTRSIELNLHMNDCEASFLMGLLQNPSTENEAVILSQFRQTIFNALKAQGVKPL